MGECCVVYWVYACSGISLFFVKTVLRKWGMWTVADVQGELEGLAGGREVRCGLVEHCEHRATVRIGDGEVWSRRRKNRLLDSGRSESSFLTPRTPRSGYSTEAVPSNSYYSQPQTGTIGKHLPKEIIRIERDWSGGEVCQ